MVLLKLSEASKRCGISAMTLRNWIKKDQIEGVKRASPTGQSFQYYMDERVVETLCKSDTSYVVDEEDKRAVKITNAMDRFSQQINGLSLSMRDVQTNAAIQLNETNRHQINNKLEALTQSQNEQYKSFNIIKTIIIEMKESIEIIENYIVQRNITTLVDPCINHQENTTLAKSCKDLHEIHSSIENTDNYIDTEKTIENIPIKKKLKVNPNEYDKFGGR